MPGNDSGLLGLGIAGLGANLVSGLFNTGYNMWAQGETWRREDTAFQRHAADMRAAGFSPLAGMMNSPTSSPINIGKPEVDTNQVLSAMLADKQMKKEEAEIGLIGQQKDKLKAETSWLTRTENDRVAQETHDEVIKNVTADIMLKFGLSEAHANYLVRQLDAAGKANDLQYARNMALPMGQAGKLPFGQTMPQLGPLGLEEKDRWMTTATRQLFAKVTKFLNESK